MTFTFSKLAIMLGYLAHEVLMANSTPVKGEGDKTWYITPVFDGKQRWAVWCDKLQERSLRLFPDKDAALRCFSQQTQPLAE